MRIWKLATAAALLGVSGLAQAALIISQDPDYSLGTAISDKAHPSITAAAAKFELNADAKITDFHWWGGYNNDSQPTDDFTIQFFAHDPVDQPGSLLASWTQNELLNFSRTDEQTTNVAGVKMYRYSADVANGFVLSAATTYWFSVVNNTTDTGFWGWQGSSAAPSKSAEVFYDGGWHYSQIVPTTAFQLTGNAVPEPGTLALLGLGLAGLGLSRRRRAN